MINKTTEVPYSMQSALEKICIAQAGYIEMLAAAYLKETDIPASQAELVQVMEGYEIRWYFRKRDVVPKTD